MLDTAITISTGEPDARKSGTSGSEGGRRKRTSTTGTSSAAYPTSRPVREGAVGKRTSTSWHLARRPTSRKLRGKELITKPGRTRRYHMTPQTAGTIVALLTLREHVIAPILAGVRSPRMGRKPVTWTRVDRDYEKIRIDMQTLFHDLGITTGPVAA